MYIIDPDPYSSPCFRIGPFTTKDVTYNYLLPPSNTIDHYLTDRFKDSKITYTRNGREAIQIALAYFKLEKDDVVSILTTSSNYYISSCVTKEIEKFCQWNREIIPETKVIFVNHEFGFTYPDMEELASLGIPIIEDCAHSFFSQTHNNKLGRYGDFTVFSFPKIFPIQIGGLLLCNNQAVNIHSSIDDESLNYIKKVLSHYIDQKHELLRNRALIYDYGIKLFSRLGFSERFKKDNYSVPSVMLLNNNGIVKDLPALKSHLWQHGIHSSVFYGEDAFYLPSHQNLSQGEVDYFVKVVQAYINKQ